MAGEEDTETFPRDVSPLQFLCVLTVTGPDGAVPGSSAVERLKLELGGRRLWAVLPCMSSVVVLLWRVPRRSLPS